MAASPICLIQWLDPNDHDRETAVALRDFANDVSIYHADVQTKVEATSALAKWFQESGDNAQYCFLGTHGVVGEDGSYIGLGASRNQDEFVLWKELWGWYAQWELKGGLWLGACQSSDAATALSPFLSSGPMAIPHFYSFSVPICASEIQQILLKLLEFTRIEEFIYLDQELELLRASLPDMLASKIELYYPAYTLVGANEYVNVDKMLEVTGKTLHQLLEGM